MQYLFVNSPKFLNMKRRTNAAALTYQLLSDSLAEDYNPTVIEKDIAGPGCSKTG